MQRRVPIPENSDQLLYGQKRRQRKRSLDITMSEIPSLEDQIEMRDMTTSDVNVLRNGGTLWIVSTDRSRSNFNCAKRCEDGIFMTVGNGGTSYEALLNGLRSDRQIVVCGEVPEAKPPYKRDSTQ
jgi:hypothetical protein